MTSRTRSCSSPMRHGALSSTARHSRSTGDGRPTAAGNRCVTATGPEITWMSPYSWWTHASSVRALGGHRLSVAHADRHARESCGAHGVQQAHDLTVTDAFLG